MRKEPGEPTTSESEGYFDINYEETANLSIIFE